MSSCATRARGSSSICRPSSSSTRPGLSLLLNAQRRIQRAGGALAVVTPPERVRRVFEMTRLDRAFRLCETREEALASLDQPLPLANASSAERPLLR